MINRFRNGMRVKVVAHSSFPELNGFTGTVVRLLISTSEEAWVKTDQDLPENRRCFPADDEYGRGNHIKFYFDELDEIKAEE